MNFHYPAHVSYRPKGYSRNIAQLGNQKVFSLSGDRILWRSVTKLLLVLGVLLLAVHLWQAASMAHLQRSAEAVATLHKEHLERQIGLKVLRDQLLSPERVLVIAAEKLALHVPGQEQVRIVQ